MKFEDYQEFAETYGPKYNRTLSFIHFQEEVAEVTKILSKIERRGNDYITLEDAQELIYELGDVLATLTLLSNNLGWSLSEVAKANVKKLIQREEFNLNV